LYRRGDPRVTGRVRDISYQYSAPANSDHYTQSFRPELSPNAVFNIGNYICDLGEWNQKYGGNANTGTGTININPGAAAATWRPTLVE
jgi:hypothetical protein